MLQLHATYYNILQHFIDRIWYLGLARLKDISQLYWFPPHLCWCWHHFQEDPFQVLATKHIGNTLRIVGYSSPWSMEDFEGISCLIIIWSAHYWACIWIRWFWLLKAFKRAEEPQVDSTFLCNSMPWAWVCCLMIGLLCVNTSCLYCHDHFGNEISSSREFITLPMLIQAYCLGKQAPRTLLSIFRGWRTAVYFPGIGGHGTVPSVLRSLWVR